MTKIDELRISNFPGKIRHISIQKTTTKEVVLHNKNGFFQEMLAKRFFREKMQSGIDKTTFQVFFHLQYAQ